MKGHKHQTHNTLKHRLTYRHTAPKTCMHTCTYTGNKVHKCTNTASVQRCLSTSKVPVYLMAFFKDDDDPGFLLSVDMTASAVL